MDAPPSRHVAVAAGYFAHTPGQSDTGIVGMIAGKVTVIIDMTQKRRHGGEAAGFSAAAAAALLFALMITAMVRPLAAVVPANQPTMHGSSGSHAMRLLHCIGVILPFLIVTGIPGPALRSNPEAGTQPGGTGPPAARSASE